MPENRSQKKAVISCRREWRLVEEEDISQDTQKKGEVTNVLTSERIHIDILLHGSDNYHFKELLERNGFGNINYLNGICLELNTYNQCYCDGCIDENLYSWNDFPRIVVFEDFLYL